MIYSKAIRSLLCYPHTISLVNIGNDPDAFSREQAPDVIHKFVDMFERGEWSATIRNAEGRKTAKFTQRNRERIR